MNRSTLDRILACKSLPSLPGVALRLLELARDPQARLETIAQVVQNDPALTVKVLRTVNSSYYGLAHPCPTISRAVGLLGLNAVKSLVLGFCLVEMARSADGRSFDLARYWRRAVYGAAAARRLARASGAWDAEEAFIAALLQDVGMLAAHAALREEYAVVLDEAPEDHEELPALERARLGIDHAAIGAALGERWRLPQQITRAILDHHEPDRSPADVAALTRLVALGADGAAAMTLSGPLARLGRFGARAGAWFGIDGKAARSLLREICEDALQLTAMLELNTGQPPDIASLLAEANEQLVMQQLEADARTKELSARNRTLERRVEQDPLTGLANRARFERVVAEQFQQAQAHGTPVALVFMDADHFKLINDTHGHAAGDGVLVGIAARLRKVVGAAGTVCRQGGEEFAVVLPGMGLAAAARLADAIRAAVAEQPIDLNGPRLPESLACTVSAGVAAIERAGQFSSPAAWLRAADEALYAAKHAGRNCVRSAPAMRDGAPAGRAAMLRRAA